MDKRKKAKKGINPKSDFYVDYKAHKIVFDLGDGTEDIVSDELGVTRVYKNLDTQKIVAEIYHKTNCTSAHFEGTLTQVGKGQLFNFLTGKGVVVNENYISPLSRYLTNLINDFIINSKLEYIHEKLGWAKENDYTSGYLTFKSINAAYSSTLRKNDEKLIGPNGDKKIYDQMIKNEVIPNKSMHLPLVLGFIAPLVPIMSEKTACPVLITNFAGKSSQGKTTSMALMASIWGNGKISNTRLAITKSFASTQNGIEAAIRQNNGFPVLYDDYETASRSINFGQLIYTLAQGESKTRCGKNGMISDTFSWRTFIGLTGESSIFDRAGHNLGLKPRIVEFKNQKWTVSKENSINITSVVTKHYGFYGEKFVAKLMKMSKKELNHCYDECENIINDMLPPVDNISERIQTRLSLIRMTAVLVKKLMNLDIDIDYVTQILVDNEKERQNAPDIFQEAMEAILEFLNMNYSSFITFDNVLNIRTIPNKQIYGRIYKGRQGTLIAFLPSVLQGIMCSFNDREAIFEKWRDEGLLVCDKGGRFTKKVRINEKILETRCYCFSFKKITELFNEVINNDIVEMVDLETEDNLNSAGIKQVKYIDGERYIHMPIAKDAVLDKVIKRPHYLENINVNSSVKPLESLKETPICEISYDDSLSIQEIFSEFNKGE